MIIDYFKCNILNTRVRTIAHGCNAQGVMGSGVALAIRNKYPMAYAAYRHADNGIGLKLGNTISWTGPHPQHKILHMITQQYYGRDGKRYVSYDALADCFGHLETSDDWDGPREIAIPRIGCGLGGGDWDIVSKIIDRCAPSIDVYVYDYEPAN